MKSTEVYKLLRAELSPGLKAMGFKRAKGFLSWERLTASLYTVLWCQVSQDGWEKFRGSKFTFEIQRSQDNKPGSIYVFRSRLAPLLPPDALEEIRAKQNGIIEGLHQPPSDYYIFQVSPAALDWYLSKFQPESEPYTENTDIWFRYTNPAHVQAWGRFLASKLPAIIEAAEHEA